MPNGKCYRPYRLPGKYNCSKCKDLKDAEEFYKDSSRFNGCSSRCKNYEKKRSQERYRHTDLQVKNRAEEILSTAPKKKGEQPQSENLFVTCSRKDGRSGIVTYFDPEGNIYAKRGMKSDV